MRYDDNISKLLEKYSRCPFAHALAWMQWPPLLLCGQLKRLFLYLCSKVKQFIVWVSAPEFPGRGIGITASAGVILFFVAFWAIPKMLRIGFFDWGYAPNDGKAISISFFTLLTAITIAPTTLLVWYWRHVARNREMVNTIESNAMEWLVSPQASIRIKGLNSLAHLVEVEPRKLLEVLDTLVTFIRNKSDEKWEESFEDVFKERKEEAIATISAQHSGIPDVPCEKLARTELENDANREYVLNLKQVPELEAALRIFSEVWERRFNKEEMFLKAFAEKQEKFQEYKPDFEGVHFNGARLSTRCFRKTNFREAHLERADCQKTNFKGADCHKSHFEGADCRESRFEGADCSESHFAGAICRESHFEGADCRESHFEGTDCLSSHFEGADCGRAHFEGADWSHSRFDGANCGGAYFVGASCCMSHFEGANCRGANFQGAACTGAHFEGADFVGVKIGGAHFPGAYLQGVTDEVLGLHERLEIETKISDKTCNQTYESKEMRELIDKFMRIATTSKWNVIQFKIRQSIKQLQDAIGKPPSLPEGSEYYGVYPLKKRIAMIKGLPEGERKEKLLAEIKESQKARKD